MVVLVKSSFLTFLNICLTSWNEDLNIGWTESHVFKTMQYQQTRFTL